MRKTITQLLLLLALVAGVAFGQANPIANSKHNLSSSGTGSIKSTSETQICVFCHTPHGASNLAPLWNRNASAVATYTLYSSPTLIALLYPGSSSGTPNAPVQPTAKSKLCLSCHDGTVALGQVLNRPGSGGAGTIPNMQNVSAGGGIPTTQNSNLGGATGADLSNDHPVGYLYDSSFDAELVVRAWPWNTAVKLEPDTGAGTRSTGTVQCLTCHDPHDNQNGSFMRMPNAAALCTFCHTKANFSTSGHAMSTQVFTPLGSAVATTVGGYSCVGCHRPHGALSTPLLRGVEQDTCYNVGCHGNNNPWATNVTAASGTTWRNIQTDMNKASAHPTNALTGLHTNKPFVPGTGAELPADFASPTKRHAECQDCHNPHQVKPPVAAEKSTRGTIRISLALTGTWGVEPTWGAVSSAMVTNAVTFAAPTGYTVRGRLGTADASPITDEYQVCMKCHSSYTTLPAGARNIAEEINPGNSSYHGIVPLTAAPVAPSAANLQRTNTTNFYVNQNTMAQPWAGNTAYTVAAAEACRNAPTTAGCVTFAASRGRVWCSDCHGSNLTATPPAKAAPYGPHGSTVGVLPAVLAAKIPPAPAGSSNGDKMLIGSLTPGAQGTPLCLKCHLSAVYVSTNTNSRFTRHAADGIIGRAPQGCLSCHMWNNPSASIGGNGLIYPHGLNQRWYTLGTGAAGTGTGQMVDAFNGGWYTNMDYTTGAKKCWTTATGNVAPAGVTPCNGHGGVGY